MSDDAKLKLADEAIAHVLHRISISPEVGYYMGHGTESYERLLSAYAELHGQPIDAVRKQYVPACARDPRRDLQRRIEELEENLAQAQGRRRDPCDDDVPTYGPQNLTGAEFRERVQQLLLGESYDPARFVDAVAALFECGDLPIHLLARRS